MRDVRDLLAEQPVFAGLDEQLVTMLAGCALNLHVGIDGYLFRTGEPADRCCLVRQGRIALEIVGTGGSRVTLDTIEAGTLVGLAWLVPPYRWALDARAVEPTDVVSLDAACLRRKCEDDPRLGYHLLQRVVATMYERMQSARVRLLDIYGPADAR